MAGQLQANGLSVHYGAVKAVDGLDLLVEPGRLTGLIGPNGAGKTTCIDALTGFVRSTGAVTLDGRDISKLGATERARCGLARTWQSTMLFDDLTVEENIAVAANMSQWWRALGAVVRGRRNDVSVSRELLRQLGIESLSGKLPRSLPPGQRKLVGIARALATKPTVICLDEPAAGLNTEESESLGQLLRQTVDRGLTMLLVDHDMSLVLSVCDDVVVLDMGARIFRGTPAEVQSDSRVLEAYLGGEAATPPTLQEGEVSL